MKFIHAARVFVAAAAVCAGVGLAHAQGVVKLGLIAEFSGPFAQYGQQIYGGMKTYMKLHGDTVAGKKIEVIQKDVGGPAPDVAKRLAQELVTRDKVDFLVGFGLTPNALAVAPVATEAKVPMIIMNAATSIITTKSPYIARVSMTLPQITQPIAVWAAKNGIKKVYTVVADYGPGHRRRGGVHQGVQGRRRRDRRQRAHAAAEPGVRAVHPAGEGCEARCRSSCSCPPASRGSRS